ncbi:MAG: hypothetical protein GY792_15180 [Gammaproteobacteria bacterium]|nr:hypothetical protein [Gammaproteobacteria bacterium]
MKGIVFTEYIEFVEETFSADIADEMIDESDLLSEGAYTAIGTYNHEEILFLITTLSRMTETPVSDLVQSFGKHLFSRLASGHPEFLEGIASSLDFMELIESRIHVEVRKLYPDAELPCFEVERPTSDHLILTYRSQRPFADLAMGLIEGCADHFGEQIEISRHNLEPSEQHTTRFDLIRVS